MTAAPAEEGFTCKEAYDLITDVEQESQKPRKTLREPDYYLDNGKAQITAVTSTHLHITTRH